MRGTMQDILFKTDSHVFSYRVSGILIHDGKILLQKPEDDDEEMTVTLDLEDGTEVTCAIVTILTVQGQDYIVLLPLEDDGENHDGMVWFYRYHENENDPNEEPELEYIEDDEEYENVSDAFDEYLDNVEFDEVMDEEE